MEHPTTTNQHENPSTVMKAISGIAGFATFIAIFAATFYFGFQALIPLFAGGLVGLVAGVIAAAVARKRGRSSLAPVSVIVCIVAGGIGGLLLAAPVAILMIAVALLLSRKNDPRQSEVATS